MTQEQSSRRRLWRLHTIMSVEQGTTVLFLEGRLGHAAAAELATIAGQRLPATASGLIIDLSGVDYLSSAALKVFQSLADGQSRAGGRLTLRAPSVSARLALDLSGLLALVDSAHPEDVGVADEPPQT
jgi:anti-anti-sigma factor